MTPFDWAPYFGDYGVTWFAVSCFLGAMGIAPLLVLLLSTSWAIRVVRGVAGAMKE